jgi:predicted protein tyrosine phosphatase
MDELVLPLTITICARDQVGLMLASGEFDAVISINDPRNRPSKWDAHHREKFKRRMRERMSEDAPILFLWFWDGDGADHDGPRASHIESIRSFVDSLPAGTRLLIHCRFGISRSTAAGVIALCRRGLSFSDAWKVIQRVRPTATPNEHMLKLAEVC